MYGMDPMNQADQQLKQCPQHIEKLRCAFIDGDWASKAAGEEMLQDFYGAIAKDAKDVMSLIRSGGERGELSGKDLVVSHAALERRTRDIVRRAMGPTVIFVVLDVPREELMRRKVRRLEESVAAEGKPL